MIDNYHANKEIFDVYPQIKNEVKRFIVNERKMYRQNKNWNNGLAGMSKFFRLDKESSKNPKLRSFLTRKYAHTLITKQMLPQLPNNSQICKLLKSYKYTYKILALRCISS
jgi:hypothetical protein